MQLHSRHHHCIFRKEKKGVYWRRLDLQSRIRPWNRVSCSTLGEGHLRPRTLHGSEASTLAMKAMLPCAHIHLDRPSLRASARALALHSETLSSIRSVCMGTSSTKLCQFQLENFARVAFVSSHSSVQLLQRPQLIAHF